jgi:hypothetical protein
VHHVAVALDRAVGIDAHGAGARDAAEIVAREVDQHHVLGVLLRVGEQLVLERDIVVAACAARGRVPAIGRSCARP